MTAFSIRFDATAADAGLDQIGEEMKARLRPAAQAGAQVLYDETRLRVPVRSGLLRSAIYQVFSQDNSDPTRATYHVSWNARKAPHGHLVEFGTSRAPAHPFLRPAFETMQGRALQAARDKLFAPL